MPYNQKKFNKENPDNYLSLFYQKVQSFFQWTDTKESLNRALFMSKVINTNQWKEGDYFYHCAIIVGIIEKLGKIFFKDLTYYEGEFKEGKQNG